jgi:hypothetical protein
MRANIDHMHPLYAHADTKCGLQKPLVTYADMDSGFKVCGCG